MKSLLRLVRKLDDHELRQISDAIDVELSRRIEQFRPIAESTGHRPVGRQFRYHDGNGVSVPMARAVESRQLPQRRAA